MMIYFIFHTNIKIKFCPILKFQRCKGLGIQHISKEYLKNIQIPIPSIEKQKEIVELCDKITNLIDTNNVSIQNLKETSEKFIETISKSTHYSKILDLCNVNVSNMKKGQFDEINYVQISDVNEGNLLTYEKLTGEFPSRAKRIVRKDSILYSTVRPNLRGYVYINEDIPNCIASTGFMVFESKSNVNVNFKFIYYYLTTNHMINHLMTRSDDKAMYPSFSLEDLDTVLIPIISIEKQNNIVEFSDTCINEINRLTKLNSFYNEQIKNIISNL